MKFKEKKNRNIKIIKLFWVKFKFMSTVSQFEIAYLLIDVFIIRLVSF